MPILSNLETLAANLTESQLKELLETQKLNELPFGAADEIKNQFLNQKAVQAINEASQVCEENALDQASNIHNTSYNSKSEADKESNSHSSNNMSQGFLNRVPGAAGIAALTLPFLPFIHYVKPIFNNSAKTAVTVSEPTIKGVFAKNFDGCLKFLGRKFSRQKPPETLQQFLIRTAQTVGTTMVLEAKNILAKTATPYVLFVGGLGIIIYASVKGYRLDEDIRTIFNFPGNSVKALKNTRVKKENKNLNQNQNFNKNLELKDVSITQMKMRHPEEHHLNKSFICLHDHLDIAGNKIQKGVEAVCVKIDLDLYTFLYCKSAVPSNNFFSNGSENWALLI